MSKIYPSALSTHTWKTFSEIMATCGHNEAYASIPPPLDDLTDTFPYIKPNTTIDRSIPRCKFCDLIKSNLRAEAAECPPPGYINPVDELHRKVQLLKDSNESQKELQLAEKNLADAISASDERIKGAWMEHWAIWGVGCGDGPDRENVYLAEEGEVEEPEPEPEKPVAVVKIKGAASSKKIIRRRAKKV